MENKASKYTFRISITNSCNLNCMYCNPQRRVDHKKNLSDEELIDILKAGYEAGLRNITWTGGEPTMRQHFDAIIAKAKKIGYINQHMTTNGIVYYAVAERLKKSGLTRVNFSLDTLDPEQYKKMCGLDGLNKLLKSIDKAIELYGKAKINTVVTRSNFKDIDQLIKFTELFGGKLTTRFLEIVPCGENYDKNASLFDDEFVPIHEIISYLGQKGKLIPFENTGNVPGTLYYKIEGMKGIYGVNPNYSKNYECDKEDCKKVRMNPEGYVSNCTIQMRFARNLRGLKYQDKVKVMKQIVNEKINRNYKGFKHKQKFYDFWRFAIHNKTVDDLLNK